MMSESIQQLLRLQERDLELDRLQAELAAIPGGIAGLKDDIEKTKQALEESKKELMRLQLVRKEREIDLESKEAMIRKFSTDLNAVRTNDAYRAMAGEIDKLKQEKSSLEDEILQTLEQLDQVQSAFRANETVAKEAIDAAQRKISDLEARQTVLEQQIGRQQQERSGLAAGLSKDLVRPYEQLRHGKRGAAVVPLKSEQCSGCHMKVSQNLINEIRRGQTLNFCEHCSRIVYLEDVLAQASERVGDKLSGA